MNEAERDAFANALGRAYAAGLLDGDELDRRLDVVLAATTHDEAAAATGDLPPAPPGRERARKGWWRARHGEADRADPAWLPTKERFVDPTTQRVMRVWVDPADRRRHYVPD